MKKLTMLLLSVLLWTVPTFSEKLVPVSYTTQCGAFIEEFVPENHWRLSLREEDRAPEFTGVVRCYEREVFVTISNEEFRFGIDILAFLRNESLRKEKNALRGYLVEVNDDIENGSVVNGTPEGQEPGFVGRQWNTLNEQWEENPWRVVAAGTGVFLLADYFLVDSGEINLWGLLSSSSSSGGGSESADGRATESSNAIIVSGDNNQVTITSNVDRSSITDRSVSNPPPIITNP